MSQIIKPNSGGGPSGPDLHVARFIVSAGGTTDGANYTTFAAAYTAAVAAGGNQTIFLQPGTYNIGTQALTAGINVAAFNCDAMTPNVTINGKMTASIAGNCSFSGINFLNSSDNILDVAGAGTCNFTFTNCFINVSGSAYAFHSVNPNCVIEFFNCQGDISGTSSYFNMVDSGGVNLLNSFFFNGQNESTQNILNETAININSSTFDAPINASGVAGDVSIINSTMVLLDATLIITSGANSDLIISNSFIDSNNATAISIGASSTMTIVNSSVGSSATNAIDGAGTLIYGPITFNKSSSTVTTAVQTALPIGPDILPAKSGTAGQVWTSNGAGVPPTFQAAGGGGGITEYFSTYLSAPALNVTGDGTIYNIPFDGIITNSSASYNAGTGLYTAPSAGQYCFTHTVVFDQATTSDAFLTLWNGSAFSTRAFQTGQYSPVVGGIIFSATIFIQMAMGDTMGVSALAGGGTKTVDIYGAAPSGFATTSLFSGFRVAT